MIVTIIFCADPFLYLLLFLSLFLKILKQVNFNPSITKNWNKILFNCRLLKNHKSLMSHSNYYLATILLTNAFYRLLSYLFHFRLEAYENSRDSYVLLCAKSKHKVTMKSFIAFKLYTSHINCCWQIWKRFPSTQNNEREIRLWVHIHMLLKIMWKSNFSE